MQRREDQVEVTEIGIEGIALAVTHETEIVIETVIAGLLQQMGMDS